MIDLYSKLRAALTKFRDHQAPAHSKDEDSWLEISFRFRLQFGDKTTD
ncbi:hypothetical protein [Granulicella aggregans]|nr:hypothetical protein [Granulicella aggregans]